MKYIKLKFATENWLIPLDFVARHRADYYQEKAIARDDKDFSYQEEVDYVMNDDYEGEDWLKNNMNYSDFENVVIVEKDENKVNVDWCNAESEVIEK